MHFLNKVLQHLFCHLEICNHAILERADGCNVARCSTQHPFRIYADCSYRFLIIVLPDGNDRGFIQDDAPSRTYISVLAVPRSIDKSLENKPRIRLNMKF